MSTKQSSKATIKILSIGNRLRSGKAIDTNGYHTCNADPNLLLTTKLAEANLRLLIELCGKLVFDFTRLDLYESAVGAKENALIYISNLIAENVHVGNGDAAVPIITHYAEDLFTMCSENILRPLPPTAPVVGPGTFPSFVPELAEKDALYDMEWHHLQPIYEIFVALIFSPTAFNVILQQKLISNRFLFRLLANFESENIKERDLCKTALHRIYSKGTSQRTFIRRLIAMRFSAFSDCESEAGVEGLVEILEVMGSIINGFARPLKEEHIAFLHHAILPLHHLYALHRIHGQLVYCITQFVEKEPTLIVTVLQYLYQNFPYNSQSHAIMYLTEIEDLLDYRDVETLFPEVMDNIVRIIVRCKRSIHVHIAERAYSMWGNLRYAKLMSLYRNELLPILAEAYTENHWSPSVQQMAEQTHSMLFAEYQDIVPRPLKKDWDDVFETLESNEGVFTVRDSVKSFEGSIESSVDTQNLHSQNGNGHSHNPSTFCPLPFPVRDEAYTGGGLVSYHSEKSADKGTEKSKEKDKERDKERKRRRSTTQQPSTSQTMSQNGRPNSSQMSQSGIFDPISGGSGGLNGASTPLTPHPKPTKSVNTPNLGLSNRSVEEKERERRIDREKERRKEKDRERRRKEREEGDRRVSQKTAERASGPVSVLSGSGINSNSGSIQPGDRDRDKEKDRERDRDRDRYSSVRTSSSRVASSSTTQRVTTSATPLTTPTSNMKRRDERQRDTERDVKEKRKRTMGTFVE